MGPASRYTSTQSPSWASCLRRGGGGGVPGDVRAAHRQRPGGAQQVQRDLVQRHPHRHRAAGVAQVPHQRGLLLADHGQRPGQNAATRSRATSGICVAMPSRVRIEPISTGTGMSRPRPLASNRRATASCGRRPRRGRRRCRWAVPPGFRRPPQRWPPRCPRSALRVRTVERPRHEECLSRARRGEWENPTATSDSSQPDRVHTRSAVRYRSRPAEVLVVGHGPTTGPSRRTPPAPRPAARRRARPPPARPAQQPRRRALHRPDQRPGRPRRHPTAPGPGRGPDLGGHGFPGRSGMYGGLLTTRSTVPSSSGQARSATSPWCRSPPAAGQVARRPGVRLRVQLDRVHPRAGHLGGDRQRDRAGAGAQVDHQRHRPGAARSVVDDLTRPSLRSPAAARTRPAPPRGPGAGSAPAPVRCCSGAAGAARLRSARRRRRRRSRSCADQVGAGDARARTRPVPRRRTRGEATPAGGQSRRRPVDRAARRSRSAPAQRSPAIAAAWSASTQAAMTRRGSPSSTWSRL